MTNANPIDVHVGSQLAAIRRRAGRDVSALAAAIDTTEIALAAMEAGMKRIGAAQMQRLARELDVPIGRFFEGAAGFVAEAPPSGPVAAEGMELNRAFVRITDPEQRRLLVMLAKAMAGPSTTARDG